MSKHTAPISADDRDRLFVRAYRASAPGEPIAPAMASILGRALDALEREEAREVETARVARQAQEVYAPPDAVAVQVIDPAAPVTVRRIGEGYSIGRMADVVPIVVPADRRLAMACGCADGVECSCGGMR